MGFRNTVSDAGATPTPTVSQATLVGSSHCGFSGSGVQPQCRVPGGTKAGDLIFLVAQGPGGTSFTAPSGYTDLFGLGTGDCEAIVYYKVAAAADATARVSLPTANGASGYRNLSIITIRPVTAPSAPAVLNGKSSTGAQEVSLGTAVPGKLLVVGVASTGEQFCTGVTWGTAPADPPTWIDADPSGNGTGGVHFTTVPSSAAAATYTYKVGVNAGSQAAYSVASTVVAL